MESERSFVGCLLIKFHRALRIGGDVFSVVENVGKFQSCANVTLAHSVLK
jgi:hypothetical protein